MRKNQQKKWKFGKIYGFEGDIFISFYCVYSAWVFEEYYVEVAWFFSEKVHGVGTVYVVS